MSLALLAQSYTYTTVTTENTSNGMSPLVGLLWLAIWVLCIVALWKIFTKAGVEGWKSIIPFYNTYCLIKICKRPGWWFVLLLIPFVNLVIWIILALDLAKVFGKSVVFAVFGLILFSIVGLYMLAFGDAKYEGGGVDTTPTPPQPAAV